MMNLLEESLFLEWPVFDLTTDVEASTIWEDVWSDDEIIKNDDFAVLLSVGMPSETGDDLLELTLASSYYNLGSTLHKDLSLITDTPLFSGVLNYGSGFLNWTECTSPLAINGAVSIQVYLAGRKMQVIVEPLISS